MIVRPITTALDGEHLLAVSPVMRPDLVAGWNRRLNLHTGRALSDVALTTEQHGRAGRLALRGQLASPGIVTGLEVALEREPTPDGPRVLVHIAPGLGLAVTGEDVALPRAVRVDPREIAVYAPARLLGTDSPTEEDGGGNAEPEEPDDEPDEPPADAAPAHELLEARRLGPSLGELIDRGVALPGALVLVLQPVVAELVAGLDPDDPCEEDPSNYAFEDWQLADGCRLVWYAWPEDWAPLPPRDEQWRNRIAWAVFDGETTLGLDDIMPWDSVGVPLCIAGFDDTWAPLWVDRHAVARTGGSVKRRTPLVPTAGTPFLWQARIRQLAEQVADTDLDATGITGLARQFRFLPPTGVLPAAAIEPRAGRDNFFPAPYAVDAVPVPLEQLDVAIEASAALTPFDLFVPDEVRVLVPVPQVWYEPRLLLTETVDPIFQSTIDRFLDVRREWLRRRKDVRAKFTAVGKAIGATVPDYTKPEPDAHPDEANEPLPPRNPDDPDDPLNTNPEDDFGTIAGERDVRLVTVIENLRGELTERSPLRDDEVAQLDAVGLPKFIDFLEDKVRRANDRVDLGFLRAQTDIYRLRQLMLGDDAATRLATSPALASIAKGTSALATRDDLAAFVSKISSGGTGTPPATGPTGAPREPSPAAPTGTAGAAATAPTGERFTTTLAAARLGGTAGSLSERLGGTILGGTRLDLATELVREVEGGGITSELVRAGTLAGARNIPSIATRDDVILQNPIVGKALDFRTITLAERLESPPAPEAKSFSVATKYEAVNDVLALDINVDDLAIPGFIQYDERGKPVEIDVGGGKTRFVETTHTVADIREKNLAADILADRHDLDPANGDEAAFFSGGVRAIDNAVAVLRVIEGRVQAYRNAIERCRAALAELQPVAAAIGRRLGVIADELAEARHDVAVARALLAEEQERIAAINARRDAIIAEHVTFLAYHRPRAADVLTGVPSRAIDPGPTPSPVPACTAQAVAIPRELRAMVDLLRDVPVRWLPRIPPLLDRIDRLEALHITLQQSKLRAAMHTPVRQLALAEAVAVPATAASATVTSAAPATASLAQSRSAAAVTQLFAAQQDIVARHRAEVAQVDLSGIAAAGWQRARERAVSLVSLGDLIDVPHGRPDLSRLASGEIEQIARVAGCLYARFGEVRPAIRLDWAERLSVFDAPANLRNLASLPQWGSIELLDRREMQQAVDWLFGRVDPRLPEAVGMINDLVRVCLLLASHAPVGRILSGHVRQTTPARPGTRIDLTVVSPAVRIGMQVLMYAGPQVVARGVVEDLGAGGAAARVVTADADVQLAAGAHVEFAESEGVLGETALGRSMATLSVASLPTATLGRGR